LKITIVDYGIGNLHSIRKALEQAGAETEIISDMNRLEFSQCIVFPGVGAFGEAMGKLSPVRNILSDRFNDGVPALGICLGMQILFENSEESPLGGIGFIGGAVRKLDADRVPQMGWNNVVFERDDPIFRGVPENVQFYFANSYGCYPTEEVSLGMTTYGKSSFSSVIRKRNVFGFQYHPEKSSVAGLRIISNFVEMARSF